MDVTNAWVLDEGPNVQGGALPAQLELRSYPIAELREDEALLEPLFGVWEGNYGHALERSPIDVCRARGEPSVVLGNCGVVRVLTPPATGSELSEGDVCLLTGNAVPDRHGYMIKAHAYDAPNTVGILARRTKAPARQLIPLGGAPASISLEQWAAFSLRYITAWSNWRVAYGAWRLQVPEEAYPEGFPVWAWGGGTAFAELQLAARFGASTTILTSQPSRVALARRCGIEAVDRSEFAALSVEPEGVAEHERLAAREQRRAALKRFVARTQEATGGEGVSIFVDNIGGPVVEATLRALAREGVLATAGWKKGMALRYRRAVQCIARHTLVHTHYASDAEARDAVAFAKAEGWVPPKSAISEPYRWEEIPRLAAEYRAGRIGSYFPLFSVNPV